MKTVNISVDFNSTSGKIKPMHGINCVPVLGGEKLVNTALFHYMSEAKVPYSRLHDMSLTSCNRFVDIPMLFPDFDADENDPASYDFTHTDVLLTALIEFGMEPLFRLGISIENSANIKAYHVFPPKDYAKWARVAEHVILHYNYGWADGYKMGIKYWEVWFEPDVYFDPENIAQTWHGTRESYFEFYNIVSKHLKKCFGDEIAVGGYAGMGFKEHEIWDPDLEGVSPEAVADKKNRWAYRIDYFHKFLAYVKENNCPLDYYSWHAYSVAKDVMSRADYCRKILDKYGFKDTPHFLDEWNTITKNNKLRKTEKVAANTLAMLIGLQKSSVDMGCYYIATVGASVYSGLISADDFAPYKTYFAFKSFGMAYTLANQILAESDDEDVYTLGATDGKEKLLLIANTADEPVEITFNTDTKFDNAVVIKTDDIFYYTAFDGIIKDNTITVAANSMTEIRIK